MAGRVYEYKGWRIEEWEGRALGSPTLAGLKRGEMVGRTRKEKGYLIHYPDGGTKLVPTMKAARAYIDNY